MTNPSPSTTPDRSPTLPAGRVLSPETQRPRTPVSGEMENPKTPQRPIVPVSAEIQDKQRQKKAKRLAAKADALQFKVKKVRAPIAYDPMDVQDPLPTNIRMEVPALQQSFSAFVEENRKRTRDASGSSVESAVMKLTKIRKSGGNSVKQEAEYNERVKRRINKRIQLIEFHLDCRQSEVIHLNQARQGRAMSSVQYIMAMESLEGQICHIRRVLIILHQRSNMLRGEVLDCHRQLEQLRDIDMAIDQLINNLVRTYTIEPAGMTSHPEARCGGDREGMQEPFRKSLVQYYNTREPNDPLTGPSEGHWCPISHCYHNRKNMRAAHIVPFAIGEFNCAYLFGRSDSDGDRPNHLFDVRNGLLIHEDLEEALDRVQLAIVPCESEEEISARNLKVVVMDKSILKKLRPKDVPWAHLQDRPLLFRNENRPRLQYLYFTFLMNIFRRRRYECHGWKNDLFQYAKGKAWGSPEGWLRGSTMRTLCRRVGHEADLEEFLGTDDLPLTTGDQEEGMDERYDNLASQQIQAAVHDEVEPPIPKLA